jgi:hypothetical protein
MRILVVRTDSPNWAQALCFAQRLCDAVDGTYLSLCVATSRDEARGLPTLPGDGRFGGTLVREGDFYQEVLHEIEQGDYDLILLGADIERPGELHHAPTSEYIAQQSLVPVGIVRSCPEVWDRVLVCARAPDPALPVSRRGMALAARLDAIPTVLHVVQPPAQAEAPPIDLPLGLADELIKVRHGSIPNEIQAEVKSGNYSIAIVGAHATAPARGGSQPTLAQPDIMRQVLELELPMVIVVGGQPAAMPEAVEAAGPSHHPLRRMIGYVAIEIAIYGVLVVAYAMVAFRFLVDRLNDWFHSQPTLYAILALLLIVGQGILLEEVTSFLLDRLRLERFE